MAVADHKKKLIALANIITKAVPMQNTDPAPLEIVAPSSSSVEIVAVCIKDMYSKPKSHVQTDKLECMLQLSLAAAALLYTVSQYAVSK